MTTKLDFIKNTPWKFSYLYDSICPPYHIISELYDENSMFSNAQLEQLNAITKSSAINLTLPISCYKSFYQLTLQDAVLFGGVAVFVIGLITGFVFFACAASFGDFSGSSSGGSALNSAAADVIIPVRTGVTNLDLLSYYNTSIWEQASMLNEIESEHVANFPHSIIEPTFLSWFFLPICFVLCIILFLLSVCFRNKTLQSGKFVRFFKIYIKNKTTWF